MRSRTNSSSTSTYPRIALIAASPRSGTTLLGEIIGTHPEVGYVYEPYYIWYYHVSDLSSDAIPPHAIGPRERQWIRDKFQTFSRVTRKSFVVPKSGDLSLNLPVAHAVFPEAKVIHILRDGRDVISSMKEQWDRRQSIMDRRSLLGSLQEAWRVLQKQPLWRFRALLLWYELRQRASINPRLYLNKAKWEGYPGWGLRFKGWREMISSVPRIVFIAHQWLRSVEQLHKDLPALPKDQRLEIRYEDLVSVRSHDVVRTVFDFLDLPIPDGFFDRMPRIRYGNTAKWPRALSPEEIGAIGPVISKTLIDLGYAEDDGWYAP